MTGQLIEPHGGTLVDLRLPDDVAAAARTESRDWPSWDLTPRQLCDLELLGNGGFSPLDGFLNQADYTAVVDRARLADGTLWPIPVTLDVSEAWADGLTRGDRVALRDPEGTMLAALEVGDVWQPDREAEAERVYGTVARAHPGVGYLLEQAGPVCVGGRVQLVRLPAHYDFAALRRAPCALRALFAEYGWDRVVAFQTRNPMHRAHYELTRRAAEEIRGGLLVHPVVGMTKPGDVDHFTRVRCYQALMPEYPAGTAVLSLLPLAMRMGGPREAVWHAIIRKNYGCTHLIVGRDHAGPGVDPSGQPFYDPYAAQDLVREHEAELGVAMVPFQQMVYVQDRDRYLPVDEVPEGASVAEVSGTELRRWLAEGRGLPAWLTFEAVARELARSHPPRARQGFTVFFTGLSGAGKSTIANVLRARFLERGERPVTLLDGDIVRRELSSELGFSKAHRDLNIRRIGFVASEITKNGGIAICAPIAPYAKARDANRELIERWGGYVLVHVATPIEECERRDRKGLYAKARAGIIPEFTGVSDPYEEPTDAELTLDTTAITPEDAADAILQHLADAGYLMPDGTAD